MASASKFACLLQDYVSALSNLLPSNQSAPLSASVMEDVRRLAHEAVSFNFQSVHALSSCLPALASSRSALLAWNKVYRRIQADIKQELYDNNLSSIALKTENTAVCA